MRPKLERVCSLMPTLIHSMQHIYAALTQKERALISERTKAALRAAKPQGTVLGNPRLSEAAARGTAAGKSRASLPQICCRCFEKSKKAGASSLNAIADVLNKRGIRLHAARNGPTCRSALYSGGRHGGPDSKRDLVQDCRC